MIEAIGIFASIVIFISMLFKTNTYKGAFLLRLLNSFGSVIFIVYGLVLPAYSTAFLNMGALIINIFHLFRMKRDYEIS